METNVLKRLSKAIALALILVLILLALPLSTIAEESIEARIFSTLDKMWSMLDAVEEQSPLSYSEDGEDLVERMLQAAYENPYVDASSITDITDDGFAFATVDGIGCIYSIRLRSNDISGEGEDRVMTVSYQTKSQTASTQNVLLIGPYYGYDDNFTDQYLNEADSIAQTLGGTYTLLSGKEANASAICEALTDKAVVIIDSHGYSYKDTSYIMLTSDEGLSSRDYNNGYAYSFGRDEYGIDGGYLKEHTVGQLASSLIWIPICEGMKTDGLATPLREMGAEVVFGYSQNVTFISDYEYETYFFEHMKNGYTVAEAAAYMKDKYADYDIYGGANKAYPIFVSDYDPYPENPDSIQEVKSDWVFPFDGRFAGLSSQNVLLEYDPSGLVNAYDEETVSVNCLNFTPTGVDWTSLNPEVAQVRSTGDGTALIFAKKAGTATIRCTVYDGEEAMERICAVTVQDVGGVFVKTDEIECGVEYLITATLGFETYILTNEAMDIYYGENSIYDYLVGAETDPAKLSELLETAGTNDCIYSLIDGTAITDDMRWVFSEAADGGAGYNIRNVSSGWYLARFTGGNMSDLVTENEPEGVSRIWYYRNGGLCARSHSSQPLAYITLNGAIPPYFSSGKGTNPTSSDVAVIQLYKKTELNIRSVTFSSDDATETFRVSKGTILADIACSAPNPPEGYVFAGWALDGVVQPGGFVVRDSIELFASYAAVSDDSGLYTVTLFANSGQAGIGEWTQTESGEALTLPEAFHDELRFLYWYDGENRYAAGAEYTPHENDQLVAIWEQDDDCEHSYANGACEHCGRRLYGDVNCDGTISAYDAAWVLRYIVRLSELNTLGMMNADVDGSNTVSSADAAKILRYIVRLETDLG
ncbi:MAG: dockerin type I domain-containing protein [Clostridia bacterium]|nr:dockerin type I domain-containing protein [Clostridia bacterium]